MNIFTILVFLRFIAVAVGVGGSLTREFLIVESLADGHIDHSENKLIKGVDGLLRAMFSAFFVSTVCLLILLKVNGSLFSFTGLAAGMEFVVVLVLGAVSIAGEAELFPYTALSAVSSVSWLALFFFELFGGMLEGSFAGALFFYVIALMLGIYVFESVRKFSIS
jgi:hypothetical protein